MREVMLKHTKTRDTIRGVFGGRFHPFDSRFKPIRAQLLASRAQCHHDEAPRNSRFSCCCQSGEGGGGSQTSDKTFKPVKWLEAGFKALKPVRLLQITGSSSPGSGLLCGSHFGSRFPIPDSRLPVRSGGFSWSCVFGKVKCKSPRTLAAYGPRSTCASPT